MKNFILLAVFFTSCSVCAQFNLEKKTFIKTSINWTFGLNQNYEPFNQEDDKSLIEATSIMLRVGYGYQFNKHWAVSINSGFDHHYRFQMNAIPYYGSLRYNFRSTADGVGYITSSLGKTLSLSSEYDNGDYYALGIGCINKIGSEKTSLTLQLTYHKKYISNLPNGNLNSLSLGIGLLFL